MRVTELFIDGEIGKHGRSLVLMNGRKVWIQGMIFKYLVKLAVKGDWLNRLELNDIGSSETPAKYISRLKKQLKDIGFDLRIENRSRGDYFLNVEKIGFSGKLSEHEDFEVRELFRDKT